MADTINTGETRELIASNKVEGTAVYDMGGERLGTVNNFMVDKRSGKAEYAVMQFGGFLGIGADYYPIHGRCLTTARIAAAMWSISTRIGFRMHRAMPTMTNRITTPATASRSIRTTA